MLINHLDNIFNIKRNSNDGFAALAIEKLVYWTIMIQPMLDPNVQYHPDYNTYTTIITSIYHVNEHNNLFSKLQDACANLSKHSNLENDNLINALYTYIYRPQPQ